MSQFDTDRERQDRADIGHRSSREIKHDIDRTLSQMDQTVDQLQGRLSIRGIVHELTGSFGRDDAAGMASRASGRVWDAAKANPGPAALLGLGIAWLVADRLGNKGRHEGYEIGRGRDRDWLSPGAEYFPESRGDFEAGLHRRGDDSGREGGAHVGRGAAHIRERAGGAIEGVKDRASGALESVKDRVSGVGDSISHLRSAAADRASHLRDTASDLSMKARDRLHDLGHQVQAKSVQVKHKTEDLYDEAPLAFGAAALALGVGLGLVIPSTRKENELLGEQSDRLKGRARDLGEAALHKGEQVAGQVVDKVKQEFSSGDERSIVDRAKDVVNRVVGTTKQQVKESVQSMNNKGSEGRFADQSGTGSQGPTSSGGPASGNRSGTSPNVGDDVNVD